MVAMAVTVLNLSTKVRIHSMSLSSYQQHPSQDTNPTPLLSFSKPSWVVRTESNVHREKIRKPDPPCVVCAGSGRTDCHDCHGKGRTNCSNLEMLPKGEWPKWCKTCGGSGLGYCTRCLGTGEYRDVMGFHFMKRNSIQSDKKIRTTVADFYEQQQSV